MSDWPSITCLLRLNDAQTLVTFVGTKEQIAGISAAIEAKHGIKIGAEKVSFHDGKRYCPIAEFKP